MAASAEAGDAPPADFRVTHSPRVGLLDSPGGKQVAVVPAGQVVRGLVEAVAGELWLRIDLAPGNPLRAAKGLLAVYARVADGESTRLEWDGPMDADLAGEIFKVTFAMPFARGASVAYALESKPDGGDWNQFWKGDATGLGAEKGGVSISSNWPHPQKKAAVQVVATASGGDEGAGRLRLVSSAFTVDAGLLDLRSLDKGVPHMRKMRSELAILIRKSKNNGGTDAEQLAQIEEYTKDVERLREIRALILKRAKDYAPKRGPVVSAKRVALGAGGAGARLVAPGPREFKKVLIMGLYHSCTNAIQKELDKRFEVEVVNDWHTGKEGPLWKHRVNEQEPAGLGSDCMVILMVKEPHFWVKSCCREPRNFFELQPFREDEHGERHDIKEKDKTMQDLFMPLEHDAIIYPNIIALWNDSVRSYFDDAVYHPSQAIIVRSEDFLFRFHQVMDELAAFGLKDRGGSDGPPDPLADRAKGHFECRTRDQALNFYADAANRTSEFTPAQLTAAQRGLDPELLARLGYGGADPVATWRPPAR